MINWLLRPWVTPRIQLTILDELLGTAEIIVLLALGFFIVVFISEIRDRIRWRKRQQSKL